MSDKQGTSNREPQAKREAAAIDATTAPRQSNSIGLNVDKEDDCFCNGNDNDSEYGDYQSISRPSNNLLVVMGW
jgi:hypothetical protein